MIRNAAEGALWAWLLEEGGRKDRGGDGWRAALWSVCVCFWRAWHVDAVWRVEPISSTWCDRDGDHDDDDA